MPTERQRLDKWLFFSRAVKSRTLAQKLIESGVVRPAIDSRFALADAAAAHVRLESGRAIGKVVLDVREM